MQSYNGIYLSGWEYNRLLQEDPCLPRNTALPGEILWNGSAHLWLFEKIYFTKEAIENEKDGADRLGWATNKIFSELALIPDSGFESVDWSRLPSATLDAVRNHHQYLRSNNIRQWIREGQQARLEAAKAKLLEPILLMKGAVLAPASNLANYWKKDDLLIDESASLQIAQLSKIIESPKSDPIKGIRLCPKPTLSENERWLQENVEKPLIPDLLSGDNEFEGARGFEAYHRKLEAYRAFYIDTDHALLDSWKTTKVKLLRLRSLASRYIWKDLHNEWIPELQEKGKAFLPEFSKRVRRALSISEFSSLFDINTAIVLAVGVTFSHLLLMLLEQLAGTEMRLEFKNFIAADLAVLGSNAENKLRRKYRNLALFYQKAKTGSTE